MLKEVDKRYRDYLWSNSEEQRKVTLVASEKVRKPKKFGGINIKGCGKWNEASLAIRDQLSAWSGIQLGSGGVIQTLHWFKTSKWTQMKKEMASAIWGALIYHTWKASNSNYFEGTGVNTEYLVAQIQRETKARLEDLQTIKKARKCLSLIQHICR
uniref:Uncharacterized protein LOC104248623 n=1 Tax=Nicotiana sylvestris TaxID=4096 RepID=A0A1U7YVL3_NICSY|nr:PREDICTED: uncharacterized protein LOC104248623 [Nicotiana sylvestris]